jgi:hypothetical protein
LLIAQAILIFLWEYIVREDSLKKKIIGHTTLTLLSIIVFYWLRRCDCVATQSLLTWLCEWYWVIALAVSCIVRATAYAFLEEGHEGPKKSGTTPQPTTFSVNKGTGAAPQPKSAKSGDVMDEVFDELADDVPASTKDESKSQ